MSLKVKVINKSKLPLPKYQTSGSAGMDLCAHIETDIELGSLERTLVPTGLFLEIPEGFEAQIRPRSGLAAKNGITVLNAPGTIDSDYRGEIKVILTNLSKEHFTVKRGDRIAQITFNKVEQAQWEESIFISETERSSGGFGHTGN